MQYMHISLTRLIRHQYIRSRIYRGVHRGAIIHSNVTYHPGD